MAVFKKGERVRVVSVSALDRMNGIEVGKVGTVLYEAGLPVVEFDKGIIYPMYEMQLERVLPAPTDVFSILTPTPAIAKAVIAFLKAEGYGDNWSGTYANSKFSALQVNYTGSKNISMERGYNPYMFPPYVTLGDLPEIFKPQMPKVVQLRMTVGEYDVEFSPKGEHVEVGCTTVEWAKVKMIYKHMKALRRAAK